MHWPLQTDVPNAHLQMPASQIFPSTQTMPQPPQFLASLGRLVQTPAHRLQPGRHAHFPLWQVLPEVQTLPQAPQFSTSQPRLMHLPAHSVIPEPHTHLPW